MRTSFWGVVCLMAAGLAACGGGSHEPLFSQKDEWHPPIGILRHYAGPDGRLMRAQLETGLRKDFDAADLNHSGVLEPDEMRAVNQARWKEDQSAISPLVDWNGDGVIDFNEFAATARALFNESDRNGDGVLTPDELRLHKEGDKAGEKGNGQDDGDQKPRRGGPPGGGRGPQG